jgi:aminopeptidase N
MNVLKISLISLLVLLLETVLHSQIQKQQEYYTDSSSYNVSHYSINLSVSSSSTYLNGFVIVTAKATKQTLSKFYIELSDISLTIDSLLINNIREKFTHSNKWIKVELNHPISVDSVFSVRIVYHGNAVAANLYGGIDSKQQYNSTVLYTVAEPFFSSDFFPCKQYLTDKADSLSVNITVPKGEKVASNGLLKRIVPVGDNKLQFQWESHYPIAYYLIAFSVSDYVEYSYKFYDEFQKDSMFFQNFLYNSPEYITYNKTIVDTTLCLIKTFEKITSIAYPFRNEKYGHVSAPINGGMENQTMTMMVTFNFELIAHELAHSWFGNMVTCSDWQNIWINEGFASYFEYLAYENIKPDECKYWLENAFSSIQPETEGSVFVPDNAKWIEARIFSFGLTYRKGAYIIHILRNKINNDQLFFEILNAFLTKYAYKNASVEDFKTLAEQKTGQDLSRFFQQWYYGKGYPKLDFNWQLTNNKLLCTTTNVGSSESLPLFDFELDIKVHFENKTDTMVRIHIFERNQSFEFSFTKKPESIIVNPNYDALVALNCNPTVPNNISSNTNPLEQYIFVYPNPCRDSVLLTIHNSKNNKVELLDSTGVKLRNWNNIDKLLQIDMKSFKKGMYMLVVYGENGKQSSKIIKNL